jgi:outer membrane protein assembly factor BamB
MRAAAWILFLMPAAGAWAGEPWPQFRGPNGDGISPETGINKDWKTKPPKVLWRRPMGDNGYSQPIIADGKAFILDYSGGQDVVVALELETGKEAWKFPYASKSNSTQGYTRSTPAFSDGKLYTLSKMGLAHCLDARNGTKVWALDFKDFGGVLPGWGYGMSPLVDGDWVILVPGGNANAVVAVEKATGKPVWKSGPAAKAGYATPVIADIGGKKQYLVFMQNSLIGVEAANGKLLWSHPWATDWDVNAAAPIAAPGGVFITSGYKTGCALVDVSGAKPREKWRNKEIQSHFNSAILHGGMLYSTTDPGRLVCLDPATGTVKWEHKGFEKGGLCAIDGALIVVDGANGAVVQVALEPNGYRELGRIAAPLGGKSWTAPVAGAGKLLIRNLKELAALDLK